ncbi:MAG: peptide chain release factor 3 [Candidatus Sumerlaeia bacterium]|nr:peptide chain release factor 3 [Candidatus Sumerlaeia bacterium]
MSTLQEEVSRRRTFAIISHPDAGKTTLTEKMLLYGGAIHMAGEVKSRRATRTATSDWMAVERERGISVTTSVMQFPYHGYQYNLLDTPGHQDFSEDTYRTISAADAAIMLIDAAKGVEPQTEKLFQVCRLREMPIFTFINKMDREGREPLELMEDIEKLLGIHCVPMNWPLGLGSKFNGVYDRHSKVIHLFHRREDRAKGADVETFPWDEARLRSLMGDTAFENFQEELELLDMAGEEFDAERFKNGDITPVFFGSALTCYGVEPFLGTFGELAPPPVGRHSDEGFIAPTEEFFSGFIFKIQANMDKNHRDRIAFLRVVSGRFERGMEVSHGRMGKKMKVNNAMMFFANEREQVDEAWAGDIVGLYDTGNYAIGDTLTKGKKLRFEGIPRFCPELFCSVLAPDPMKRKQLDKGLSQLGEEGAIQVIYHPDSGGREPVLAAVGRLQFDIVKSRLESEYNCIVKFESLPFGAARWVTTKDGKLPLDMTRFNRQGISAVYHDIRNLPIILFRDEWSVKYAVRNYDDVIFHQAAPEISA